MPMERYRNYFSYGNAFTANYAFPDKFSIVATNTTSEPAEVDIFAPSSAKGVTVSSDTISMQGLSNQIISQPFLMKGLHINAKTSRQMDNPILFTYRNAAGRYSQVSLMPSSYQNSYQSQANRVDIPGLDFVLDVNSTMRTVINPGETVTYRFDSMQGFDTFARMCRFGMACAERKFRNFMRTIT